MTDPLVNDANSFPWQPFDDSRRDMVARVNYGGGLSLYASGFEDGADALYELIQTGGVVVDALVYPLVYCLRHAVELALKQVIWASRILTDDELRGFPFEHDLSKLWAVCRPILKRIWPPEGNESAYFIVESMVRSFAQVDPTGEGFRYPTTKSGDGSLPEQLSEIDLDQMYVEVKGGLSLLTGADAGIDIYLDAKAEVEAEYRELEAEAMAEYREYEREMAAEYRHDWPDDDHADRY